MSQSDFRKNKRPWLTLSLLGVVSMIASCKWNSPAPNFQGYILGSDDLTASDDSTIEYSHVNPEHVRATGVIHSVDSARNSHFCTGFLLPAASPGKNPRIVSNYHCFTNPADTPETLANWACKQTKIYLGHRIDESTSLFVGGCQSDSLRGDFKADIAVFELSSTVPEDIKPFTLQKKPQQPIADAYVIHHPLIATHMVAPMGELTKMPTSAISRKNCATALPHEERKIRPDSAFTHDVSHTCDIIEGSSGAPIIDASSGEVVAVNWGGIDWGSGEPAIENRAVNASWVEAFLNGTLASFEEQRTEVTDQGEVTKKTEDPVQKSPENAELPQPKKKKTKGGCARLEF